MVTSYPDAPAALARRAAEPAVERLICWLFAAATLAYVLTAGSNFTSGDAAAELQVARGLIEHGWVDVPRLKPGELCAGWGVLGSGGAFFPSHGIGFSLLLAPLYLLARAIGDLLGAPNCDASLARCVPTHLLSWVDCAVGGATVAVLCRLGIELGFTVRRSLAAALLYGFATLAWPYARFGFDVTPTALLLLAAVREALLAEDGSLPAERRWLRCGGLCAVALLFRLPALAAVLPLGVCALYGARGVPLAGRLGRLAALLLPLAIAIAWSAWYNWARFGSPLDDGHGCNPASDLVTFPPSALSGLLLSPGKGLLWYSPGVLLAGIAAPAFARRHAAACWLALGVAVADLLPYLAVRDWYGGDAWGPRFVLPVLPLLWLPILAAPEVLRGAAARLAGAAVLACSVAVQLSGVLVNYHDRLHAAKRAGTYNRFWTPGDSPILDHLARLWLYVTHPEAATHTVDRAESYDIWWLNLWRIDLVPPVPVFVAAGLLLLLTVWCCWRLVAAYRAAPP